MTGVWNSRGVDASSLNPFDLFDQMDREFDSVFRGLESFATFRPFSLLHPGWWTVTAPAEPRCGLYESDDALFFYADVPGCSEGDVNVEIKDGVLRFHAKRGGAQPEGYELRQGRMPTFELYQSFQLPTALDTSAAEAELKNGVLTIKMPKQAADRPKRIAVRTA